MKYVIAVIIVLTSIIGLYCYFRMNDAITITDEMHDGHYMIMYNYELRDGNKNNALKYTRYLTDWQAVIEINVRRLFQVKRT